MMKTIDELWFGNISPFEQCTRGDKRLKELLKLVARNREELDKSDDDAKLTMELVQSVCRQLEVTLPELMELCPTACGKSEKFNYQYTGSNFKEMLEIIEKNPNLLSSNKKEQCLNKFIPKRIGRFSRTCTSRSSTEILGNVFKS